MISHTGQEHAGAAHADPGPIAALTILPLDMPGFLML